MGEKFLKITLQLTNHSSFQDSTTGYQRRERTAKKKPAQKKETVPNKETAP